jgi:hypothetical protein
MGREMSTGCTYKKAGENTEGRTGGDEGMKVLE